MNTIDAILYINLDHRQDRRTYIESELSRMGFDPQIVHRISAIYDPMCGHLGCGLSHIKALQLALKNQWKRVIILEDDFKFLVRPEELYASINVADTITISRSCATVECPYSPHTNILNNKYCCKSCQSNTTHGFLCEHIPASINKDWDVLLLAKGHNKLGPLNGCIRRVELCTTTSGYIVKAHYINTLIQNFMDAVKKCKDK